MKVGVIEHFDSMHRLPGHPKCGTPHGHTYRVEVTVESPVKDGMVIDFDVLKRELRDLLKRYDHTDLNEIVAMPTCENLAQELHRELKDRVSAEHLTIRLWEGEGKWAETGN